MFPELFEWIPCVKNFFWTFCEPDLTSHFLSNCRQKGISKKSIFSKSNNPIDFKLYIITDILMINWKTKNLRHISMWRHVTSYDVRIAFFFINSFKKCWRKQKIVNNIQWVYFYRKEDTFAVLTRGEWSSYDQWFLCSRLLKLRNMTIYDFLTFYWMKNAKLHLMTSAKKYDDVITETTNSYIIFCSSSDILPYCQVW